MPTTTRRKRNPIWFIARNDLVTIVAQSTTLSAVLRHFGLMTEGAYHDILKTRLKREGIDISHISLGAGHNKGKPGKRQAMSKEDALKLIFVENSPKSRIMAKSYIRRYNLIPYSCECGNEGEWRGKKLSLQLDHVNGVPNDHQLENMRWICPNCHSQTETFAGRANRVERPPRPSEVDPLGYRKRPNPKLRRFIRPSRDTLSSLVWSKPLEAIAEECGASSGNTIKKWCRQMGIERPPMGYWQRRESGHSHEVALHSLPRKPRQEPVLASLTQQEASVIRQRVEGGESQRALAREYKVSRNAIHSVVSDPNYGSHRTRETPLLRSSVNE